MVATAHPDGRLALLRSAASLADPSARTTAARELAESFGVDALIILVRDPGVDRLLSAPGFPQTLPDGRLWHAFLDECVRRGRHEGTLPLRSRDERLRAIGYANGTDAAFVLLGVPDKPPDVEWFRELLPMLAAVFRGEQSASAAAAQAAAARESAGRAKMLTETLDRTRRQLEGALAAARQKAAEVQAHTEELERTTHELDTANRRLAGSERSIRDHAARFWGLTDAAVAINSATRLDDVLRVITDKAREVIGAHQAVTSMTTSMNWAQAINAVSLSEKYAEYLTYAAPPDGSGIYAMVCEMNRPVRMTQAELESHPRWRGFGTERGRHPPMRGWLAAPLIGRNGDNLGVIQLSDKYADDFNETDEAILVQLAHMASVSIENARLFEVAQTARAEAEAASRAKSQFLAMMSHELRTPLNAIGGYAELLDIGVTGPVTDGQREYLRRIRESGKHLLGLINDVLNFAKLEAGRIEFRIEDVSLESALANIGSLVDPQARKRQVSFECCLGEAGIVARADQDKMLQVILNLLSNAIKATEPGGRVVLRWDADAATVFIRVEDTGIGIPAEKLEKIFEPFMQVDLDPARRKEGTGLGLAISRDLARGMGGNITVESVVGQGSIFTLELPRATAE